MKIFFVFFHKAWWILIFLALLLRLLVPDSFVFTGFIINVSSTFLLLKVMTLIHECGHLLAATLVGGIPRRMILGLGHKMFATNIWGIKLVLNSRPLGGRAWADFAHTNFTKWKYGFYVAGGVTSNVLVALLVYLPFGFDPAYLGGTTGVDIPSVIIAANLIGVINLIPFYSNAYGEKTASDGLMLLQLLFDFKGKFKRMASLTDIHEAMEYFENKEYNKAYVIFQQYIQTSPDIKTLMLMNIGSIHIRKCQLDEALKILDDIEIDIHSKRFRKWKGYFYNNKAWVNLLKNNIDQAFDYASQAMEIMSKNDFVRGTYGCVLIEKGELVKGMRYLFKNMDFNYPNNTTLTASIYLMLAFQQRHDVRSRDLHMSFVMKHVHTLDLDERLLFERNLGKMGIDSKGAAVGKCDVTLN
jgi:hypothetical protein